MLTSSWRNTVLLSMLLFASSFHMRSTGLRILARHQVAHQRIQPWGIIRYICISTHVFIELPPLKIRWVTYHVDVWETRRERSREIYHRKRCVLAHRMFLLSRVYNDPHLTGNEIRALKQTKPPTLKEELVPLLAELTAMKLSYMQMTGEEYGGGRPSNVSVDKNEVSENELIEKHDIIKYLSSFRLFRLRSSRLQLLLRHRQYRRLYIQETRTTLKSLTSMYFYDSSPSSFL